MPKSYNHLFPQLATFANLHAAWDAARRGKRRRPDVAAFERNLEANLLRLERDLRDGSYRPGRYRSFYIREPKRREISAAPFRDRVVRSDKVGSLDHERRETGEKRETGDGGTPTMTRYLLAQCVPTNRRTILTPAA